MTQETSDHTRINRTPHRAGTPDDGSTLDDGSTPAPTRHDDSASVTSLGASSGPTAGTTGTGIAADETGFGESGSLPDTAAPPLAR